MDIYTKFVMGIPGLTYSERCYLIYAYDECDENFIFNSTKIKNNFPYETARRIELHLLYLNLMYKTEKKNIYELNYIWIKKHTPFKLN